MSGVESGFTSRFNKLMVRNRLDCRIPVCQRLLVPRPLSLYAFLNLAQSTRPFQDELIAQVRHLPPYFIGKSDFWTLPYIERCQDLKNTRNCYPATRRRLRRLEVGRNRTSLASEELSTLRASNY